MIPATVAAALARARLEAGAAERARVARLLERRAEQARVAARDARTGPAREHHWTRAGELAQTAERVRRLRGRP